MENVIKLRTSSRICYQQTVFMMYLSVYMDTLLLCVSCIFHGVTIMELMKCGRCPMFPGTLSIVEN